MASRAKDRERVDGRSVFRLIQFATAREAVKLACPLVVMVVALIQDATLPTVYPEGYVEWFYPVFLMVSIIVYLVLAALSIWFKPVRLKIIHLWGCSSQPSSCL